MMYKKLLSDYNEKRGSRTNSHRLSQEKMEKHREEADKLRKLYQDKVKSITRLRNK